MFDFPLSEIFFLAEPTDQLATSPIECPDSPSDSLASSQLLTPPDSPLTHKFGYHPIIHDGWCKIELNPVAAPDCKEVICGLSRPREDQWGNKVEPYGIEVEKEVIKAKSAHQGEIDYLYSFPDMDMIVGAYFKALLYDYHLEFDTIPGYYIEKLSELADFFALTDIHQKLKPYLARYKANRAPAKFVKESFEDDYDEMYRAIETLLPEDQPKDILNLVSIAKGIWVDHLKEAINAVLELTELPFIDKLEGPVEMDWVFVAQWFGILLTKELRRMLWKADGYRIGAARLRAISIEN